MPAQTSAHPESPVGSHNIAGCRKWCKGRSSQPHFTRAGGRDDVSLDKLLQSNNINDLSSINVIDTCNINVGNVNMSAMVVVSGGQYQLSLLFNTLEALFNICGFCIVLWF